MNLKAMCAVAMVSGVAVLAGCTSAPPADQNSTGTTQPPVVMVKDGDAPPVRGGKLTYGLQAETDGWNPASSRWASSGYIVGWSIMDPLAAFDVNGNVKPYLAKSLEPSADFKQWTIRLRENVKFTNGSPVNADAVVLNLEGQRKSLLTGAVMAVVSNISVVDPLTVRVDMSSPWSQFPAAITSQVGTIAAPEMLSSPDGARHPVGSGPFTMSEWKPDAVTAVTRNSGYWRTDSAGVQMPYLDAIDFKPISDIQARGSSLRSGSVNVIETWDPNQIIAFTAEAKEGNFQIITSEKQDGPKVFIGLNVTKAPFDDPVARQAVAYATNKQSISDAGFAGLFPPANGPFNAQSPFYADVSHPVYDQAKARQLSDQYKATHNGEPIKYSLVITPAPEIASVAQIAQQDLAQVGIIMDIRSEDQATLITDAVTGNYQATGFILFGSSAFDQYYPFLASPAAKNGALSLNFTRIGMSPDGTPNQDNAKTKAAMDAARATDDPAVQKAQYKIVQEELAKNGNMLFLVEQRSAVVADNKVRGIYKWYLPDNTQGQPTTSTMTVNLSVVK